MYLSTPPHKQDVTQGFEEVWIQSFPSRRLVAIAKLKSTVYPTIYP